MGTFLLIAGAVIAAVGLYFLVVSFNDAREANRKAAEAKAAGAERAVGVDIGKILEEVNKLLDKVDKRYRLGLALVLLGAAMMIVAFVVK
jgi:putative Mn2+ efflux pump MntP